jgi:CBS-domain-containing membrane protein
MIRALGLGVAGAVALLLILGGGVVTVAGYEGDIAPLRAAGIVMVLTGLLLAHAIHAWRNTH